MKALIIANGSIDDYKLLRKQIEKSNFILCVDGGVDHILRLDIVPNIVFGDLDSISEEGLNFIKDNNITLERFPSIKDSTDTELALKYLIGQKYKDITLMGVTGSRQDHTLANIFLLNSLLAENINGKIIDKNNIIYLKDDYLRIKKMKDYYISVIPIERDGISVTLNGFFYNLENRFIPFGSTLGVSNEILEEFATIKIHKGKALIIQSKD